MSSLRLIILIAGLIFIAVIYFWESIKNKRLQRRQTIRRPPPSEHEYSVVRTIPEKEVEDDFSDVLSELNQELVDSKDTADLTDQERLVPAQAADPPERLHATNVRTEPETRDMFTDLADVSDVDLAQEQGVNQAVSESQIVVLHITALPTRVFNGNDILDAVNDVGLEYGDMNIFHHYGVGDLHGDRPLFSLADMFEPGHFDISSLDRHTTRGLTMFFCLPSRIDGQVVFELMLNTAQRLAQRLGGEIRGAGQDLIDDKLIAEIRNKINQQTCA